MNSNKYTKSLSIFIFFICPNVFDYLNEFLMLYFTEV